MTLRISLAICTYNRADILPRCLVAACSQTLDPLEYEVLVVDNASTDSTRSIVEHFASTVPGVQLRYIYCIEKGLSFARNAGGRAAAGSVVAYIDDDAIAAPDLLEQIARVFEADPQAGAVGGRIELCLPDKLPNWYCEYFDGYYSKFELPFRELTRVSEIWQYPFGANVALSKRALEEIGYFNVSMGRIGKGYAGGEEIDANIRIAALGYNIYYQPKAAVRHIILPSRVHWQHVAKSAKAAGRNWAYYEMELLKQNMSMRQDFLSLLATVKKMMLAGVSRSRPQFCVAYSQHLFFISKLRAKLDYLRAGA